MVKKIYLPLKDLSHNYHVLKLMTHSIYSIPTDGISPDEIIKKTKQWLGISPFNKKMLTTNLKSLNDKGFIEKEKVAKKTHFKISDKGREAYDNYVDVMMVWKLEYQYGKPFQLYTVSEVHKKSKKYASTHIPECAFYDWPLTFKPTGHNFKGSKEIRTFDVFEKKAAAI